MAATAGGGAGSILNYLFFQKMDWIEIRNDILGARVGTFALRNLRRRNLPSSEELCTVESTFSFD